MHTATVSTYQYFVLYTVYKHYYIRTQIGRTILQTIIYHLTCFLTNKEKTRSCADQLITIREHIETTNPIICRIKIVFTVIGKLGTDTWCITDPSELGSNPTNTIIIQKCSDCIGVDRIPCLLFMRNHFNTSVFQRQHFQSLSICTDKQLIILCVNRHYQIVFEAIHFRKFLL